MQLRNCRRCGKLFNYVGKPICNECVQQDEKDFELVKAYIYDHPKATITEVSKETGVSVKNHQVLKRRTIRTGRRFSCLVNV